jgi:hypothetical protein
VCWATATSAPSHATRERFRAADRGRSNYLAQLIWEFGGFVEVTPEAMIEVYGEHHGQQLFELAVESFHQRRAREQAYKRLAARRRLLEPDFSFD